MRTRGTPWDPARPGPPMKPTALAAETWARWADRGTSGRACWDRAAEGRRIGGAVARPSFDAEAAPGRTIRFWGLEQTWWSHRNISGPQHPRGRSGPIFNDNLRRYAAKPSPSANLVDRTRGLLRGSFLLIPLAPQRRGAG